MTIFWDGRTNGQMDRVTALLDSPLATQVKNRTDHLFKINIPSAACYVGYDYKQATAHMDPNLLTNIFFFFTGYRITTYLSVLYG